MANPPRARKRVNAVRRASDGSAFEECYFCGVKVAIALLDMHDCVPKSSVKRFKVVPQNGTQIGKIQSFADQPRSPFRLFMESFSKDCGTSDSIEVDRKGFMTWKSMSIEERRPYEDQAMVVIATCEKALLEEIKGMLQVDDEALSARVMKSDEVYEQWDNSDSYASSWDRGIENSGTPDWFTISSS